ncbi:amino acid permease [Carboxydochorda subterranea]|uniref:Amino acid permease n=2 Tax=Carboxydichorda subterranea TaxID=3109565 RepID=A0ABZ1BZX6_9FIRM|nr:amino acid permease [Limnochorda sp. L945t]WRP18076.1 amino acid permease [Limnochorda sp. L945t]
MAARPWNLPAWVGELFRTKSRLQMLEVSREAGRRLRRQLTALDLTVFGVGAIIGTGIFVLTGVVAARFAGPGVILSFVLAGVVSAMAAFVYAELAAMVPVAGSAYTYAYAALGELAAWVIGWDLILEYTVAAGAVAIGWSGYFADVLESLGLPIPHALIAGPLEGGVINLPAVVIVAVLTALLIRGTRESAEATHLAVAVKLLVLALFLAVGIPRIHPARWRPFLPFGPEGVVRGAGLIFFAYIGFDAVSAAAEEVRRPQRDLARGILGSLGLSSLLYVGVAAVLTGIVPYTELNVPSPIAAALLRVGLRWAGGLVAVGALAGLTSVLLVNLYAQSRIFFAMARDGLLPSLFANTGRGQTPRWAVLLTGAGVAVLGALLPVRVVAELANIGTLAAFIIVSVGVIVLRRVHPEWDRPFRVPWVPWLPALTALASFYLALQLPRLTWMRFAAWLAMGLILYATYGRHRSRLAAG